MQNLFAYGTLMCTDIVTAVTGRRLPGTTGTIRHYRRHAVRGADYPGIVACEGAKVTGRLYRDLTAKTWHCLDSFEGEMYMRRRVTVELAGGEYEQAETYVVKPTYVHRLDALDWDFAAFLRRGAAGFLRSEGHRQ